MQNLSELYEFKAEVDRYRKSEENKKSEQVKWALNDKQSELNELYQLVKQLKGQIEESAIQQNQNDNHFQLHLQQQDEKYIQLKDELEQQISQNQKLNKIIEEQAQTISQKDEGSQKKWPYRKTEKSETALWRSRKPEVGASAGAIHVQEESQEIISI